MSPRRLPSVCMHSGCPNLAERGDRCETHRRKHQQNEQNRRGTAAERGYDARHRRWRTMVLARQPLCAHCMTLGRVIPSTVADHIVPLSNPAPPGGHWSLQNGQGLCHACHNRKTNTERAT